MAITKIHAIKSTLGKALAYIENPDKTDGQMLVSGYNCEPQTASIDFEMTAVLAHKARNLKRKRSTNLAYHLIQSFSPEDAVTPEQAHELGKKLAFEYTGGKYEYVVATHIDKGHIHNHIMLNTKSCCLPSYCRWHYFALQVLIEQQIKYRQRMRRIAFDTRRHFRLIKFNQPIGFKLVRMAHSMR